MTGSPPASVAAPDLETPTQLKRAQRDGMVPSISVGRERPNSISLGPEILGFELSDANSTHNFAVSREVGGFALLFAASCLILQLTVKQLLSCS